MRSSRSATVGSHHLRSPRSSFTYALIEAAQRTQVDVLLPCAMSNHYAVIFDRYGRYP